MAGHLQVLPPLIDPVSCEDFDGVECVVTHECSQASERLPSTATHSQEQSMTLHHHIPLNTMLRSGAYSPAAAVPVSYTQNVSREVPVAV